MLAIFRYSNLTDMKNIISNIKELLINLIKVTAIFTFVISGITNVSAQIKESIDEPVPWYQIELIVFEYTNTKNVGTEIWQQQPGNPKQDLSLELMDSKTMLEKSVIPDPYLLLDPEELQLTREYNLLRSSPQRNPVLHVAWRQPANSKNESIPIRIHGGKLYSIQPESGETSTPDASEGFGNFLGNILGNENIGNQVDEPGDNSSKATEDLLEQIEGTIKISRARYLHVWTDLIYRIPSADIENISYNTNSQDTYLQEMDTMNSYASNADFDTINTNQDAYSQPLANFRLQDHRRMRSKELHYIDHPLFGVIVIAMPYELPELPAEESPAEEIISSGEKEGPKQTDSALKTGEIRR
ncbi:MAG: hypothetical protein KAS48_00950 [Gammaproteobacteria bacterium]|nr:hypothetical protein [Gammaproteobacteria bacterium]